MIRNGASVDITPLRCIEKMWTSPVIRPLCLKGLVLLKIDSMVDFGGFLFYYNYQPIKFEDTCS